MPHRKSLRLSALLVVAALALAGCPSATSVPGSFSGNMGAPAAGGLGVNVGGAQDIKLVRELIDRGQVPRETQLTAQGLYAEHDLPVAEAPAGKALHLALGLGIAPALPEGKRVHWVQVGLGSGLSAEQFKRPPQHLVVVADRSGSMAGEKIAALRQALSELVDRLDERDSLGIVLFDHEVETIHALSPVTDKAAIKAKIANIRDQGSTDIESGLRVGFDMFKRQSVPAGYQRRVLLFTDALPNTGRTDANSFEHLVSEYGQAGIGMTAFGIGYDFGAELAETIGNQRGGNYVFLRDAEDVSKVFREDFDFLMSPAAYDFLLSVTPAQGFKLTQAYGVSNFKQEAGTYELKVKSLFFSKNRGAIMLRMEETAPGAGGTAAPVVAKGVLTYTPVNGESPVIDTVEAVATGDRPTGAGEYYAPTGIRKAVALTNEYLGLTKALELYHAGQQESARNLVDQVKAQLEAAKSALQTTDLDAEIRMITKLAANMGGTASPSPSPVAESLAPSPVVSPSAAASTSPQP